MPVVRNYETPSCMSRSLWCVEPCGRLGNFQHHREGTAPRPVSLSALRQVTDTPVEPQHGAERGRASTMNGWFHGTMMGTYTICWTSGASRPVRHENTESLPTLCVKAQCFTHSLPRARACPQPEQPPPRLGESHEQHCMRSSKPPHRQKDPPRTVCVTGVRQRLHARTCTHTRSWEPTYISETMRRLLHVSVT